MHIISKNIKALRLERGWTQQEMADMLFVTRQTVSNWENGKALPDVETLLQIAEKLDVDVNELVYGKRQPDERLKKDVLNTLKWLGLLFLSYFIVAHIHRRIAAATYLSFGVLLIYSTIRPLILFFAGMLLIQIFKYSNVIKTSKGLDDIRILKTFTIAVFVLCFLSVAHGIIGDISALIDLFLIRKFNIDLAFLPFYYNIPECLSGAAGFFWTLCMGEIAYKPPYELSFALLGIVYELAKPYKREGNTLLSADTEKEKISIKKFISQPDIYLKKLYIDIKDTLKFITGKSIYVRNCAIIIFSAHFICAVSGKHSIMLRKYIHTGIASPLTLFIIGIIIAILLKRNTSLYITDSSKYQKFSDVVAIMLFTLSFAAFIPYILREFMIILDSINIISVTGTYDITGWVLTPPLWFDRLNKFFIKINTSSKIWWWAVLGFVNEVAKPYHGKEKYNNTDK